ncbi:MAG: MATE family efflux transporter [Haloarculaceae archaeon]
MLDVETDEIRTGSLPRVLLLLAVPLVAQNLALVAQQVVDLFWVGRLGGEAVAAVGLSSVVVGLAMVPVLVFAVGSQVVTAQRVGAGSIERARLVPVNAAGGAVLVTVVVGAGLVGFAPAVVDLFGTSEAVANMAVAYLTAYSLALVATGASDALESGFTGWGDMRAAFLVNATAIAVNVVVDPLLILGYWGFPEWGVAGAAVATAVGYAVGAGLALGLAVRGRGDFRLTRAAIAPDLATVREILDVGLPIAGQNTGRQVARLLVVAVVSLVAGGPGLAAYHIGAQVATVAFVPAQGLGQAATSVVGQNLGARSPDRARRTTWLAVAIAAGGLAVLGAVQWLGPAAIARVFVPDLSGQALAYAVTYLEVLAYGYPALGVIYAVEAGFNGANRTKVSMYSTLLQYWAVRLPLAAGGVVLLEFGVEAVFWAVTLSNVAAAVWLLAYFRYTTARGLLRRAAEEAASGDETPSVDARGVADASGAATETGSSGPAAAERQGEGSSEEPAVD